MNRNQIQPIAGMITAIILIGGVIGLYLAVSPDPSETANATTPFQELGDEAKLERLNESDAEREIDQSTQRARLYGNAAFCDRIENASLRADCIDYVNNQTKPLPSAASTLEPVQNVSRSDELRWERAELYGDASHCDTIEDEDLRLYCYDELAE